MNVADTITEQKIIGTMTAIWDNGPGLTVSTSPGWVDVTVTEPDSSKVTINYRFTPDQAKTLSEWLAAARY